VAVVHTQLSVYFTNMHASFWRWWAATSTSRSCFASFINIDADQFHPRFKLTGVACYGALGHVPPSTSNNLFFPVHYSAAQSDSDFVRLPLQTNLQWSSHGYMILVQCIISCHFMCDKVWCSFCPLPPSQQIMATPLFKLLSSAICPIVSRIGPVRWSRGFTSFYYDLDTLAQNAHYHLFTTTAAKLTVSIICTQLNQGYLAPCGWEPVVMILNCLLLNMNSTNETLLFDRFLIMYDFVCFHLYYLHFSILLYTCANVICITLLLACLLTYLLTERALCEDISVREAWHWLTPEYCSRAAYSFSRRRRPSCSASAARLRWFQYDSGS